MPNETIHPSLADPRRPSLGHGLLAGGRSSAYVLGRAWSWTGVWMVLMVGASLLTALAPAAQVLVVARLVRAAGQGLVAAAAPLAVLGALVFVVGLAGSTSGMVQQRLTFRLERRYLDQLVTAVARLSPQQLADDETSARIEACRTSAYELGYLANVAITGAGAVVTAISLCSAIATLNPWAGLLVGTSFVPSLVASARVAREQDLLFVPYGRARRRASYLVDQLVTPRTATELVTLGSARQVAVLADESYAEATRLRDKIIQTAGRGEILASVVATGLLGGALVAIVVGGAGGAGVAAGVLGVITGTGAVRAGGFAFGTIVTVAPKVEKYRELVRDAGEAPPQPVTHQVSSVELVDVEVTYPASLRPALAGVNLRADIGTVIALVGVNGAGKTTAVNALLGIVDVDAGRVLIDGVDAADLPLERRLGCFGLLTQEFGRYELTVRDTVRLGTPEPVDDERVWAALEASRVADVVRGLPDGLDTQLGQQFGGVGLSGGQWQRLALARVHLRDAGVWVLDEPTSAIDAEAEQHVFAELQRHKAGRITVVVSHRAWTLRDMDHIYVFDEGRVVERGRYDELLAAGGRFAQIFAQQA